MITWPPILVWEDSDIIVTRASTLYLHSCWTSWVYQKTWLWWGSLYPHHSISQKIHTICSHNLDRALADGRSYSQLWNRHFHTRCSYYNIVEPQLVKTCGERSHFRSINWTGKNNCVCLKCCADFRIWRAGKNKMPFGEIFNIREYLTYNSLCKVSFSWKLWELCTVKINISEESLHKATRNQI